VALPPLPRRFGEHLRASGLLDGARHVAAALSGGSDSTALLALLAALPGGGFTLQALHVRHLLRGAAGERDAAASESLAEGLGVPFRALVADVPSGRRPGESLEAAARRLRYAALLAAARELGPGTVVATGHTLDDQAETVLLNLARRSGRSRGGIRERRPDGVVRPLLPFRREELRALLRERGIPWAEDETNDDPRLARNRIRLETLPALERRLRGCAPRLARAGAAWSLRLERLDAAIGAALAARQAPLEGPWPRALFAELGREAGARLLVRAAGGWGGVPGRAQLDRALSRLGEGTEFAEGLAGGRIAADSRAVRTTPPAKLLP
jgi:tRNA(Ile)-lysidine synthase